MARNINPQGLVPLAADPTTGLIGDTYWNTTNKVIRTFDGATWFTVGPYTAPAATSQVYDPASATTAPSAYPLGYSYGTVLQTDGWPAPGTVMTTKRSPSRVAQLFLNTNNNLSTAPSLMVRYGATVSGGADGWSAWGSATAPTSYDGIDLTSATEVTLTSTAHPLRIGPASGKNLAVDRDSIQGRNNGNPQDLFLQEFGGSTYIGPQGSGRSSVGIRDNEISAYLNNPSVGPYDYTDLYIARNGGDAIFGHSASAVFTRIFGLGGMSTQRLLLTDQPTVANDATRKDYVDRARSDSDIMNIMGAF